MMKQNIVFLYSSLKVEKIINESDTDDFLNQFKLRLYQTYKNILGKLWVGLLVQ